MSVPAQNHRDISEDRLRVNIMQSQKTRAGFPVRIPNGKCEDSKFREAILCHLLVGYSV